LRWWAEFPWFGAAAAEVVFALSASTFGFSTGIGVTLCCSAVGLLVVHRASASARVSARELTTYAGQDSESLQSTAADSRCQALAIRLQDADEDLLLGRIDVVMHERIWFEVWEQLAEPGGRAR
jgi:hypothetical protein